MLRRWTRADARPHLSRVRQRRLHVPGPENVASENGQGNAVETKYRCRTCGHERRRASASDQRGIGVHVAAGKRRWWRKGRGAAMASVRPHSGGVLRSVPTPCRSLLSWCWPCRRLSFLASAAATSTPCEGLRVASAAVLVLCWVYRGWFVRWGQRNYPTGKIVTIPEETHERGPGRYQDGSRRCD